MMQHFRISIAVAIVLALGLFSVIAQEPTPEKKIAVPKSNQVYVKIILPEDPDTRGKDQIVVESWIAEHLKNNGQTKFIAVTGWVPVVAKAEKKEFATRVWDAVLEEKGWGCPVSGEVSERADGRIKVHLYGWSPRYAEINVSLMDEPGSREIAPVKRIKKEHGHPYVAVLVGPPPEDK
jgi:hypothetical protein